MATDEAATRSTSVAKLGAVLVLASASLGGFLHQWEADKQQATTVYADRLARGVPTVCDGITPATSPYPMVVGDVWSAARCAEVNRRVVETTQLKLLDCITHRVGQNTFDALTSHAHNVGVGNTCASRALGLINAGRLAEGCRALAFTPAGEPNWSYVTRADGRGSKQFVQGLHNRRKDEMALCLRPDGGGNNSGSNNSNNSSSNTKAP